MEIVISVHKSKSATVDAPANSANMFEVRIDNEFICAVLTESEAQTIKHRLASTLHMLNCKLETHYN